MNTTATHHRFIKWALALLLPLVAAAALLGTATTVVAEDPPEAQAREKVLERMRVLRAWKIDEHFDLDKATQDKLLKLLDDYDTRMLEEHHKLSKQRRRLKRAVRNNAPDKEIERQRLAIIDTRKKLDALRYERLEKASAMLQPRDRVKLMIFLPKFEREVRKVIKDVRKGERRKGERRKNRQRNRGF